MEGSISLFVFGIHQGALQNEQLHNLTESPVRCPVEWCNSILVFHIHQRAFLDEKLCELTVTADGG